MFRVILPILTHLLQVIKTEDYKQLDSPLQVPYNLTKNSKVYS